MSLCVIICIFGFGCGEIGVRSEVCHPAARQNLMERTVVTPGMDTLSLSCLVTRDSTASGGACQLDFIRSMGDSVAHN